MHFKEACDLLSVRSSVPGVGLAGLRILLKKLGNPEKKFKVIQVAGTNGKGSVCTLLAHTLATAGYKTGLFISPHLIHVMERITINDSPIPRKDLCRILQKVISFETIPLNFFELLTASALTYFAEKNVEYVVLETGLGGRKDPTTVCSPLICVVTSIGLDHTQLLGNTLKKIATEKAGIIKKKVPVFCGEIPLVALRVLRSFAHQKDAPFVIVRTGNPFSCAKIKWYKNEMILSNGRTCWPLHVIGEKQPLNACLVYQICTYLAIPATVIKESFKTVHLRGRFEEIHYQKNQFILDGAHNPQAIKSLVTLWKKHPSYPRGTLLCGFMKDKDFPQMLRLLKPHFEKIIVTMPSSKRACGLKELSPFLEKQIVFEPDFKKAFEQGRQKRLLVCTGSFYLVGACLKKIECGKI
ncbi:MAG: bifunctional folylpolyglutamate synthase/dihydrofolate synthase [Elusimicrobiaceae bacterium]|nr:bifunctional folylpolyglutamate synthase/dihydrofolate synthase [Elusimicrobiaceae bacterium]